MKLLDMEVACPLCGRTVKPKLLKENDAQNCQFHAVRNHTLVRGFWCVEKKALVIIYLRIWEDDDVWVLKDFEDFPQEWQDGLEGKLALYEDPELKWEDGEVKFDEDKKLTAALYNKEVLYG